MIKIVRERTKKYVELDIEADKKTVKSICNYALNKIISDKNELFSYGLKLILMEYINTSKKTKK
jgi:hypothetical protein